MKKIDPRLLQSLQQQNQQAPPDANQEPILALDWGEKFCGLAWTPDGTVCLPIGVFPQAKILQTIQQQIQEKKPSKIVIGLPISGDGGENHICKAIRNFAAQEITIPVEFCNERGSSQATISPDKERIDDLAALQILQHYLRQEALST